MFIDFTAITLALSVDAPIFRLKLSKIKLLLFIYTMCYFLFPSQAGFVTRVGARPGFISITKLGRKVIFCIFDIENYYYVSFFVCYGDRI